MIWHDIANPNDPELDRLAAQYHLHPLHIEDCRHRDQNAKMEHQNGYLFVVVKPVEMSADYELEIADLDIFVQRDFVITVQESDCPIIRTILERVKSRAAGLRPDEILYRLLDELVDSYRPLLDRGSERIDQMEDAVLESPDPGTLQKVFELKRLLIELRRIHTNTRDLVGHLQRMPVDLIAPETQPFLRDVYDHLARNLDSIEIQRDLLSGAMDIYLTSLSNRTNSVMKALTIVSTISLPAIVIAGVYGMNVQHLPFADHPHAWALVTGLIGLCCVVLLLLLRWLRFI